MPNTHESFRPKVAPNIYGAPREYRYPLNANEFMNWRSNRINRLKELHRRIDAQNRSLLSIIDPVSAARNARSAVGLIYDDPNLMADTDGEIWRLKQRDKNGLWQLRAALPLDQMSELARQGRANRYRSMQRYLWARNNPDFARQDAYRREVISSTLGSEFLERRPAITENDVAFMGHIARAGGAEYISPTGRYAVLPFRSVNQPSASSGKEYEELRSHYADQMDFGQLESRFSSLSGDSTADGILSVLASRRGRWDRHPSWRYGDLAWANSQLEYLEKARNKDAYLREGDTSAVTRQAPPAPRKTQFVSLSSAPEFENRSPELSSSTHVDDLGEQSDVLQTELVPINTVDPSLQIRINTPPDAYGKNGYVLFQPNQADHFWDWKSVQYAKEFGIGFEIDTWPNGKTRGLKVTFKKPGAYSIAGRRVVVGVDEQLRDAVTSEQRSIDRDMRQPLMTRVFNFDRFNEPNRIRIQKKDGQSAQFIDISALQAGQHIDVEEGIRALRSQDGRIEMQFFEGGRFYANAFWNENNRQAPLGTIDVV